MLSNIIWRSKDKRFFVEEFSQRRYLKTNIKYFQEVFSSFCGLAQQIEIKGTVEKWLNKKADERINSTAEWIEKLENQLTDAKNQHEVWKEFKKSLEETNEQ